MEKIGSTDKASNLELDSHDLNESIDGDEAQHEAKLNLMRQRFLALKAEQEKEEKTMGHLSPLASGKDPSLVETPNIPMPRPFPVHVAADINWKRLKQTIVTASASPVRTNLGPLSPVEGNGGEESEEVEPKEEEGVAVEHNPEVFLDYWKQMKAGSPSSASFQLQSSFPLDMNDIKIDEAAGGELFLQDFEQTAKSSALEIRRIPEEVIHKKREEMEVIQAEEQRLAAERRIKEEAELVWREHGARSRIRDLEAEMWRKIQLEKRKLAEIASEREQLLSWQFRRAREVLEDGLVKQSGEIQERYGRVAVDTASRLYDVKSTQTPHPIEMRIHILRAVKNKLPKGAYVLMLTMYDRLGGQPLTWSELGSFGFGSHRPGVTRPVKHYGRYFDRLMRIEDSVFALCPPRRELKPSNVFVIELFRLANRSNPKDDAIVGWTALPMCLENLSIVEGKYKLPLMRGQHTTSTEHFRDMERNISHDLNNWLCNIYLEIRHLPLDTIESKGQVDYSFIKKQLQVKVVSKNSYLNEILYAEKPAKKSIKDGKLARNDEVDLELGQLQAVDGVDTDLNQKEAPVELPLLGVFQRKSHKKTTGISEKRHLQLGESSRKPLQQQDGEEDDEEEKDDEITSECDCEVNSLSVFSIF